MHHGQTQRPQILLHRCRYSAIPRDGAALVRVAADGYAGDCRVGSGFGRSFLPATRAPRAGYRSPRRGCNCSARCKRAFSSWTAAWACWRIGAIRLRERCASTPVSTPLMKCCCPNWPALGSGTRT